MSPRISLIAVMASFLCGYLWAAERDASPKSVQKALDRCDFVGALELLAAALKDKPGDRDLHFLASRTARRNGDYQVAEKHLKECERLKFDNEKIALERKLILAQSGTIDGVEKELLDAIEKDHPDAPSILEALARGYLAEVQFTEAMNCLNLWLERQPDSVSALAQRGNLWELLYRTDQAEKDYRRVVELAPEHFDARLRLATGLEAKRETAEATEQFERLRKMKPKEPAVLVGLARCRRGMGQIDEAKNILDGLLEKNADNADALTDRARIDVQNGEPAKAEPRLQKAVKLSPSHREAMYALAQCMQLLAKEEDAKQWRKQLEGVEKELKHFEETIIQITEKPKDADLRKEAGATLMRLGRDGEGLTFLQSALKIDPKHRPTHAVLADYYERKGKKDLAEEHRRLAQP
jgi:tetratricopeptide (TPR) repeat protein